MGMHACIDAYKTHPHCLHSSMPLRRCCQVKVCALRPPRGQWVGQCELLGGHLPFSWLNVLCLGVPWQTRIINNTTWVRRVLSRGVASLWLPPSNGALPAFRLNDESHEKTWGRDTGDQSACNYLDGIGDKFAFGTLPTQVKQEYTSRTRNTSRLVSCTVLNSCF